MFPTCRLSFKPFTILTALLHWMNLTDNLQVETEWSHSYISQTKILYLQMHVSSKGATSWKMWPLNGCVHQPEKKEKKQKNQWSEEASIEMDFIQTDDQPSVPSSIIWRADQCVQDVLYQAPSQFFSSIPEQIYDSKPGLFNVSEFTTCVPHN